MNVSSLSAIAQITDAARPALSSLSSRLGALIADAAPAAVNAEATPLTPPLLRSVLLELGLQADSENMALAAAFSNLGVPLTFSMFSEASAALARAPQTSPAAFALAVSLELPTSPATLRALSALTPGRTALPEEVAGWAGIVAQEDTPPEEIAAQLRAWVRQAGQSTENRLMAWAGAPQGPPPSDLRTTLLHLALHGESAELQQAADMLVAHLEGQQLVNLGSPNASHDGTPLYFAFPLALPQETPLAEMQLWPRPNGNRSEDAGDDSLRATIRLETTSLGIVQADLAGGMESLSCAFSAQRPATTRLLRRHTGQLAETLVTLGWRSCDIQCQTRTDFPPLWPGGEKLNTPRAQRDWRV